MYPSANGRPSMPPQVLAAAVVLQTLMSTQSMRCAGSAARSGTVVITATVPLTEVFGYATRLRSPTQGRGTFITRPAGNAQAP
ncbi:hypothetical protein [Nonomuraea diastatica]